ncbi:MAG: aminotransferase class I/II-fold pyridoxal phosphate-dependent enzyme, partial [Planctomycetota bacterium]
AQELPGTTINWGPWSETGMAASMSGADQARAARKGVAFMAPTQALALLERQLHGTAPQVAAVGLDQRALRALPKALLPAMLEELTDQGRARKTEPPAAVLQRLRALPAAMRPAALDEAVRDEVAHVLTAAPQTVALDSSFQDLGLDSLMAVELRTSIAEHFGVTLPVTVTFDYANVTALSGYLLSVLDLRAEPATSSHVPVAIAETSEVTEDTSLQASRDVKTYDMFLTSSGTDLEEMERFADWIGAAGEEGTFRFEQPRAGAQTPLVEVDLGDAPASLLNFSSYNYLGYGYHPEVIRAAKAALDRHGLGAASSPVLAGTLSIHQALEARLLEFYGLPGRGVSLFSSGYGVNLGTVSAFAKQGHRVVLDQAAHVSLVEGAQLSGASVRRFRHNDPDHLDAVLREEPERRTLVCTEGVFSADGDFGRLRELVAVTKRHGAYILVDEAHSVPIAGAQGRGVCEQAGVLEDVDLIVLTFSKGFGGVGGALIAREHVSRYVNWYARCRMFSCSLDPAVTGGVLAALDLAAGADGRERRQRLIHNAARLRDHLRGGVDLGVSESWIVTVHYGAEHLTLPLSRYLQDRGLDVSPLQFPAVDRGEARLRLFVSSEHTEEHLERAARVIRDAAEHFGFAL